LYNKQGAQATHFFTPRLNGTLHELRANLDALMYDGVVWNPYASNWVTRPLITISLFSGFNQVYVIAHCHLLECVLRKFGLLQPILRFPNADLVNINYQWIRFLDHVLVGVIPTLSPNACVDGYLQ